MQNESSNKSIAALDLGSNSFHLLVASINFGRIEIVHREKRLLRVRSDEKNKIISENKISEAISLINYFKNICENYSAEINAVATSAIREADNKTEFVERVLIETGVKVKIVSGDEEAELALLSLKYSFPQLPNKYLLFDLGGGSTEFVFILNKQIVQKFSLPIGAVRFANKHCDSEGNIISGKEVDTEINKLLIETKLFFMNHDIEFCYGMGGTVSAVSNMIQRNIYNREIKFEQLKGTEFTLDELNLLKQTLDQAVTLSAKRKIAGLEETRADIISSGIQILKLFFTELGISKITFTGSGLREGILINSLENYLKDN